MNWRGCRVPLGALSVERWEVQRVYCEFTSWYTQTGGRRAYGGGTRRGWVGEWAVPLLAHVIFYVSALRT